jgi:hypothetical protein
MPKTDKGQSSPHISEDGSQSSGEVDGRYPTDEEWESSLQRAEDVKKKHDSLFRRLAGKDDG